MSNQNYSSLIDKINKIVLEDTDNRFYIKNIILEETKERKCRHILKINTTLVKSVVILTLLVYLGIGIYLL